MKSRNLVAIVLAILMSVQVAIAQPLPDRPIAFLERRADKKRRLSNSCSLPLRVKSKFIQPRTACHVRTRTAPSGWNIPSIPRPCLPWYRVYELAPNIPSGRPSSPSKRS